MNKKEQQYYSASPLFATGDKVRVKGSNINGIVTEVRRNPALKPYAILTSTGREIFMHEKELTEYREIREELPEGSMYADDFVYKFSGITYTTFFIQCGEFAVITPRKNIFTMCYGDSNKIITFKGNNEFITITNISKYVSRFRKN